MEALRGLLERAPLTWWDVLDILIVAIAIYELLKFIRGTRAVQMAVGAGLLTLLYFVSQRAPLQTVHWLILNAFTYLVFAAIVVFQADLRRALTLFGRAPFFRRFARAESADETIEEVVEAASLLSDKRTGAIIVIEREIGLRNYMESGIRVDAQITYDLLVAIFQTSSPLHDGAAIIHRDRIAAASCFLPLTVRPQMTPKLGTRHRAAIGVTEESDAVVVVVSEETGRISVAIAGQIERGLSPDTLRHRLTTLLTRQSAGNRLAPAEATSVR